MRKALRRKSTVRSLVDGFPVASSSRFGFVRELIFGDQPLAQPGARARRGRLPLSQGLKLEALEPRLLLSAELSTVPLASATMFETEGSYPPAVAASFSPQSTTNSGLTITSGSAPVQ